MGIRMTGLVSNMDTDSIVKELMAAQSTKKTKIENKITTHEWKQEKWKDLNAKIYALYTGSLSKMKLQGSYLTKKVSSSNESKVTVSASSSAVNGSHSIQVKELASTQYITSSKVADITIDGNSTAVTTATKLTDIDSSLAPSDTGETVINFKTKDKEVALSITDKTTVNDFVTAAKSAGINASYDTSQKRFFFSGSDSGVDNYFSITTATLSGNDLTTKDNVRNLVDYDEMSGANQSAFDRAIDEYRSISKKLEDNDLTQTEIDSLEKQLEEKMDAVNNFAANKVATDLKNAYTNNSVSSSDLSKYGVRSYDDVVKDTTTKYNDSLKEGQSADSAALQKAIDAAVASEATKYASAVKKEFTNSAPAGNPYTTLASQLSGALSNYANTSTPTEDAVATESSNPLAKLGLATFDSTISNASVLTTIGVSVTKAADSKIIYNGAELINSSNTVTANGITFDLHGVTSDNETVTLSVSNDTQAVYDSIKEFVKGYNELLKELNTAYNADSARGYDPLTDDERESMTDDQIEKWETKIKDSLLRRDDKVNSIIQAMKTEMMASVEVDGTSYSLSSFGITSSLYTEKGLLHIDGDADDTLSSAKTDKLMKALEKNPESVMETLTKLTTNLYSSLTDKMKATTLSSALTFYNDKEMSKTLTQYKADLKTMETKLQDIEDKYYDQFAAMETALSKLNSQQNSLASLLGMNS